MQCNLRWYSIVIVTFSSLVLFFFFMNEGFLSLFVDKLEENKWKDASNKWHHWINHPNQKYTVCDSNTVEEWSEHKAKCNSWVEDCTICGDLVDTRTLAVKHGTCSNITTGNDEAVDSSFSWEKHFLVSLNHKEEDSNECTNHLLCQSSHVEALVPRYQRRWARYLNFNTRCNFTVAVLNHT